MIKDSYQKNIFLTLITILIFIVIPFSLTSIGDDTSAQIIDEKSVGFYQSNTCKISLFQVLAKNVSNINKIYDDSFDNTINDMELAVELELILRYLELNQTNNKKWFFNTLEDKLNNVENIKVE